jgi:hypothetical protein
MSVADYDAVVEGLARSVGAACFILYLCVFRGLNIKAIIGCCIVLIGFLANQGRASTEPSEVCSKCLPAVSATECVFFAEESLKHAHCLRFHGVCELVVICNLCNNHKRPAGPFAKNPVYLRATDFVRESVLP